MDILSKDVHHPAFGRKQRERISCCNSSSAVRSFHMLPCGLSLLLLRHRHEDINLANLLVSGDDHHLNILSKKEMRFLSDLIYERTPYNILVFGLESQYSGLISMLNVGGFTLFLEDNDDKMKIETMMISMNKSRVHKVEYHTRAEDAYKLLKDARKHPQLCSPLASFRSNRSSNRRRSGRCKLANTLLARLSQEVYKTDWDVVHGGGRTFRTSCASPEFSSPTTLQHLFASPPTLAQRYQPR